MFVLKITKQMENPGLEKNLLLTAKGTVDTLKYTGGVTLRSFTNT